MSYAVRKDGLGWRAVDHASDCTMDETWQEAQPPLVSVPQTIASITMRQCRLALLAAGLLDAVDAAVRAQPKAVQIAWEFASDVERTNPLIAALAPILGLSTTQVDALFEQGATL